MCVRACTSKGVHVCCRAESFSRSAKNARVCVRGCRAQQRSLMVVDDRRVPTTVDVDDDDVDDHIVHCSRSFLAHARSVFQDRARTRTHYRPLPLLACAGECENRHTHRRRDDVLLCETDVSFALDSHVLFVFARFNKNKTADRPSNERPSSLKTLTPTHLTLTPNPLTPNPLTPTP